MDTDRISFIKPKEIKQTPCLVVNISSDLNQLDVTKDVSDATVWQVNIDNPSVVSIESKDQVSEFTRAIHHVLEDIESRVQGDLELRVYAAVPAALAVELGRCRMQKISRPWVLYDSNIKLGGIKPVMTIGGE